MRRIMKRLFAAGMAVLLALSFTACRNRDKDNNTTGENTTTTQEEVQTTAGGGREETTPQPEQESGTTGEEESSSSDDDGFDLMEEKNDELLTRIYEAVKEAYGDEYVPDTRFDWQYIEAVYGITADMYDAVIAEGPMISFNIDTFVGFKAQSGREQDLYAALESYRDYLVNDSMQYPTNAVKVQSTQVIQHGEYVFLVCLGSIDMETEEQGDAAILAQAQEKNQIAVDVIDSFFTE